jgi:chitodextrinase
MRQYSSARQARRLLSAAVASGLVLVSLAIPAAAASAPQRDTQAPTAPSGLTVTATTQTSVTLAWSPSTDNSAVVRYRVFLNGSSVARTDQTSYRFASLRCGTQYTLGVQAIDGSANRSAISSIVAGTASCADTQPPSVPTGLSATPAATSATLAWGASTDNVGVAGYGVYVDGHLAGTTAATGYQLSNLGCGTSHTFAVDAFDVAGNRSAAATSSFATTSCADAQAPTAPTGLTVSGVGTTSATLGWSQSTDNVGVAGYGVYVGSQRVATTSSTSYALASLPCGTASRVGVDAYDAAGNRSTVSSVTVTTAACPDTQPPTVPTALAVTTIGTTSATVAWSASTDDVGVVGYGVYVGTQLLGTTAATSYQLSGLTCGTTYAVSVDAFDAAGNRSQRAPVSVTTSTCGAGSLYVATTGSDANSCTQVAPCASFQRAYALAQPGQVVQVAGGSYAYQRLSYVSKSGSARVVFQPVAGAQVTVQWLDLGLTPYSVRPPSHVELRDMRATNGWAVWDGADDVILRNVGAATFQIINASNVQVLGGDFGPCDEPTCGGAMRFSGSNLLVDGVSIHDITSSDLVRYHVDGMFVRGCQGCTVRSSKFWGNMIDNIRIQNCCPGYDPPNQNITLENNFFAAPLQGDRVSTRSDAIDIDSPTPGLVIRNNSFYLSGPLFTNTGNYNGPVVANNLMMNNPTPGGSCGIGVTYSHNLFVPNSPGWGDTPCSATDVKFASFSAFGYARATVGSGLDYHIAAASPAIGAGTTTNCAAQDIDGEARVTRCDAGSDEY